MRLRRASTEDLGFLTKLASDRTVEPYLFPGAGDVDALNAAIESADGPAGLWVLEALDGVPLGALELSVFSRRSALCQLRRVMVAPGTRRAGVGLAGVRLACAMAFEEHGIHRVQAEVYGDNGPGQRLFERAGFIREGIRRQAYWRRDGWLDGILFGLLAGEL